MWDLEVIKNSKLLTTFPILLVLISISNWVFDITIHHFAILSISVVLLVATYLNAFIAHIADQYSDIHKKQKQIIRKQEEVINKYIDEKREK